MNIQWDSDSYTKNFDFVPHYGEDLLELMDLPKGSLVADVGCGSGTLTEQLSRRGYEVIGIDASPEMIAKARGLYPEMDFRLEDACGFRLEHPADGIFSNAVFHWIDEKDQPRLAKNLADNLRPGGILVTEFGGAGCAKTVHAALEKVFNKHGLSYPRVFYFPTIGQYTPILEAAGFRVEQAYLFDRPTLQKTEDGLADWIRMFVQAPFEGIEEALKQEIISEAVDLARPALYTEKGWIVDYVRIRIRAGKI